MSFRNLDLLGLPAVSHLAFRDVDLDQLVDIRDIKLVPVLDRRMAMRGGRRSLVSLKIRWSKTCVRRSERS